MTQAKPDYHNPEIINVSSDSVSCDGGGGPIGHPLVYLAIRHGNDSVDCPYCDRRFIQIGHAHTAH